MNKAEAEAEGKKPVSRIPRFWVVTFLVLLAVAVLVAVWVRQYVYASKFTPVTLTREENAVLQDKLARLRQEEPVPASPEAVPGKPLSPEPYSEEGANRHVQLSERELNGLIAGTPDVARTVAVDLSDDLISVKLVLPVDDEVPVLGGKTFRIHMGLAVRYEGEKPYIALKGVSLGGIPLPNAWLGYLKNVNLVEEFGSGDGFWKIFSEGVRTIEVRQGSMRIILKE
ncbi:MAG: hypothetical protein WBA34_11525 [Candidatus Deferrimicrobiaceae bacterium]